MTTQDTASTAETAPASISTNEIPGWPAGPEITSETGVLIDADSGTVLYSKGGDDIRYPASITNIMTLLLAVENCSLKEDVVFTETGTPVFHLFLKFLRNTFISWNNDLNINV